MEPLTARQQQVLDLIHAHVAEHGVPPTRAEIATALGLRSPNTAEFHLKALARKGYIEMPAGRSRNLRLQAALPAVPPAGSGGLPLVGRVAAGTPMLAAQHIEGYYRCEELFRPQPDYLLRVKGMSMRDAGILEGDLLAVKRTPEAQNGQIVVARLDDEVTVKRLEQRRHRIRLLPENPDFDPIEVDLRRSNGIALVIEGIVVGVIRSGRL